jgi:SAM-dependent methyltransferase
LIYILESGMSSSDLYSSGYYSGFNERLAQAIPFSASRILEIGCGEGRLGDVLKQSNPRRVVFGVEKEPSAAHRAVQRLDQVFVLDIQTEAPPLERGSLDCLIFGDVLEHLLQPLEVLQRLRGLLKPQGWLVASIPNIGHHSVISALLQGDFQYQPQGLLDATHLRFFTFASALKLFLDAGFSAEVVDSIQVPAAEPFSQALQSLGPWLATAAERIRFSTDSYQFIVRGQLLPECSYVAPKEKLGFSVCVAHEDILQANLLASPDLKAVGTSPIRCHRGASSAAAGHNAVLAQAPADWVICVHEDVYLPGGWLNRFSGAIEEAERLMGRLDVVGVYGMAQGRGIQAGHVVDRARLLRSASTLPGLVDSLDEIVIAVRPDSGLRFDRALGWHLYGTDICLAAQQQGRRAAVVDAICLHNQRSVALPAAFAQSAKVLANKWRQRLPIHTVCRVIES